MSEKISSLEIQNFLKDFRDNAHTEVFETGREKEEIIQITRAKMGIDLQNNTDLAGFKTVYTFGDVANGNGARLPKHLLLKALPSLIGKPVNINHVRNYVVGYYIDYRYIEAENKVIAYGIFFKSNFGQEWSEAKQLLRSNLLGTSHEVWCPRKSRKYLSDGTYEAQAIEFAGGALIYRTHKDAVNPEKNMDTAYKGCDVLEMAMQHMNKNNTDLIFASLQIPEKKKYSQEDLIIAVEAGDILPKPEVTPVQVPPVLPVQQVPRIKCQNCGHEFETNSVGEIPCPECRAIIDRTGKVLYPPQRIKFSFRDPEDGSTNWRLIEETDTKAVIKNLDTGKIYELSYKTRDDNDELLNRLKFVYIGHANCPQCGYSTSFSTVTNVSKYDINCKHCGLHYAVNIKKDSLRKQINAYRDITEEFRSGKTTQGENVQVTEKIMELEVAGLQEGMELETAVLSVPESPSEKEIELQTATLTRTAAADLIDRYKKAVRKMSSRIRELRKTLNLETSSLKSANALETAKIQEDADKKINWYKANAIELIRRRESLGKFADDLSDEKIMDEDSYAKARLEKENALLKANKERGNDVVGDKYFLVKDAGELNRLKNEINSKAFGNSLI
jgi:transcription elongation factor Elf1